MNIRIERPETYLIEDTGLPYPVTIKHGVELEVDADTGEPISETVLNYESFIRTLALVRCAIPNRLNGAEVRFLRTVRDISAKDFAREMGVSHEHISRVENNKLNMSETLDRLVRIVSCHDLEEEGLTPSVRYDVLSTMASRALLRDGEKPNIVLNFKELDDDGLASEDGWGSELLEAA